MKKLFTFLIPLMALAFCTAVPAADLLALDVTQVAQFAGASDWMTNIALGGILINAANIKDAFTGFKTSFQKGLSNAPNPDYERVATTVPSTTSQENYGWLGEIPGLREWIGERFIQNLEAHDYSIKNKDYELTVGVDRNKFQDDEYGIYAPMMEQMGFSARSHPDELVFALLAAGFTTECFDGQFYFDTDHPVGDGVVSNMQAGGGNPWFLLDTRRPLKPLIFQERQPMKFVSMTADTDDAVFMQKKFLYGVDGRMNVGYGYWQMAFGSKAAVDVTNYEAARDAMKSQKNEHGRPLGVNPDLAVCGSSNEAAFKKILNAELIDGGDTNTNFNDMELMVVPWLD